MRLINVSTLKLEEWLTENKPKYAILSHRWDSAEVSYQEFKDGTGDQKTGWKKIFGTCARAKRDSLNYVWIDTCCINKANSAELSEAINSMYEYYGKSTMCYVYLGDVNYEPRDIFDRTLVLLNSERRQDANAIRAFKQSSWFTRGWTLQELIAPQHVSFFDKTWSFLGNKKGVTALSLLNKVTGIPIPVLEHVEDVSMYSIAQRMSWASERSTTRIEDMAYSLLGLFAVQMPLRYGEKGQAFIRLQEEIMKRSDDQSIFAWSMDGGAELGQGLLASSPSTFSDCREIQKIKDTGNKLPAHMTNKGLSINLPVAQYTQDTYAARLNCCSTIATTIAGERPRGTLSASRPIRHPVHIFLHKKSGYDGQYTRIKQDGHSVINHSMFEKLDFEDMDVYVEQTLNVIVSDLFYGFHVLSLPPKRDKLYGGEPDQIVFAWPGWTAQNGRWTFPIPKGQYGTAAIIHMPSRTIQLLGLGFDHAFNPVVFLGKHGSAHMTPMNKVLALRSDRKLKEHDQWMDMDAKDGDYNCLYICKNQTTITWLPSQWFVKVSRSGIGRRDHVIDTSPWEVDLSNRNEERRRDEHATPTYVPGRLKVALTETTPGIGRSILWRLL